MPKVKDKERILKAAREKSDNYLVIYLSTPLSAKYKCIYEHDREDYFYNFFY